MLESDAKMRCKLYFRSKTQNLPGTLSPATLKGSPALELFLNKTEQNLFSVLPGKVE